MSIAVTDARGYALRRPALARWLIGVAPARARGDVAVALVSDGEMRRLNRVYARRDRVTDVLSFCANGDAAPEHPPTCLGDIVIALGVASRQARAAGHSLDTELRVLALHGLLHLLGYDHHAADGGTMARVERRLRRKGGLKVGLIDRAGKGVLGPRISQRGTR